MSPVTPTAVQQTILGVKTKTQFSSPSPSTKHEAQQAPAKPKP